MIRFSLKGHWNMLDDNKKKLIGNPDAIEAACNEISQKNLNQARKIISTDYPFVPYSKASRSYTERQKTKIFIRDGFIDRYSGERLVFPGTLRLLSLLIPDEFPYQIH